MSQEDFFYFKKLYEDYKKYAKEFFEENYISWSGNRKLSKRKLDYIFLFFRLNTFFNFLDRIRILYFTKDIFEFIKKYNEDIWLGYEFVNFLLNKGLVKIENKKIIFERNFDSFFIKPLGEDEVLERLRTIIKSKIDLNRPLLYNLNPKTKFKWKAKYDQISITTKSAITIISKVSYYLPAKLNFIFIGDDDFLSIPLKMILDIPTFSLDKDKSLLDEIDGLSKKFNLDIHTINADVRKSKSLKDFYGCYTNPPYNLTGSTKFLEFSSKILSKDGGMVFMVLGDEALGKRYIHLQRSISNLGFIIRELLPSKISYQFYLHHKEDEIIQEKMRELNVDLREKETMFAALYVLEFVGKIKKKPIEKNIYSYV
jgi:predicted methyltransferase